MKVQSFPPMLKRKLRLWILPSALSIGLFSTNISQAAMSNTYTWIGGTNTNAASSSNYTATVGNISGWNLAGSTNAYIYPGTNTQTGTQVLSYGGAALVYTFGLTVTNWAGDVVMTNFADWRIDAGNLVASNSSASTLWIMGSNAVGQLGGNPAFSGNMSVYVTGLGGHSTTARTLTQNLTNLTISNLTVNAATVFASAAPLTLGGTGNTTVVGSISNKTLFVSNGGNSGYLSVNSGTLNIATTNSANTNWVSGLVLSNNGNAYVLGQLSLGSPMFDVKVGATNATNRTTFGLLNTSSVTSVALTNNFVIANTAAATNVFKAQSGKTLTLSGRISGSANGIVVADAGTLILSGANTNLSLPLVVTNSGTLVAANSSALGANNVTVASGATLRIQAAVANAITNSGSVVVTDGGTLTSGNTLTGEGSLIVGATAPSTAAFVSSLASGANRVGPVALTGNGALRLNVGSVIQSSGAISVSGTGNLITLSGTATTGTINLVSGTELTGASADSIALDGSAVGNPSNRIPFGSTYTDFNNTSYTFTSSGGTLQLIVQGGAQSLTFADASGLWNTVSSNTDWKTSAGVSVAFRTGDSVSFTNTASVTVDGGGVSPSAVAFANPSSTQVSITGGPITTGSVNATGTGDVNVASEIVSTNGITINSGNVTLANARVDSNGVNVTGGSLTSTGVTTITAGGLNVSAGSLAVSGSISAGEVKVTGGTVSGSGSITGTNFSVANATYNVALTGSTPLAVSGNASLGGANSGYSGAVTVKTGNTTLNSSSALGTGSLTLSGSAVIDLGGNSVTQSSLILESAATINNGTLSLPSLNLNNSVSGNGILSVSGTISATVGSGQTITVNNQLVGTALLAKSGTGTLALAGANDFSGGVNLSAGNIYVGTSSSLGSGSVALTAAGITSEVRATTNDLNIPNPFVLNGNTLQLSTINTGWSSTWSGPISGSGGVYYAYGDNGLTLSSPDSSFGGGFRFGSTGKLYVTSIGMAGFNSPIGTNGSIVSTNASTSSGAGTLRWIGYGDEATDKNFILGGSPNPANATPGIIILNDGNNAAKLTLTLNGNIQARTNTQAVTLGAYSNNSLVLNGQLIETNGAVIKLSVGTSSSGSVLINHTNNNISGGVTITNPTASTVNTLRVSKIGNAGEASPLGTNGTIGIAPNSASAICALVYTGTGETNNKNLLFSGTNGGILQLDQSGSGPLKYVGGLSATAGGTRTINLVGSTNVAAEFAGGISDMGGTNSLTKNGTGTWTLSGNNSYSGSTLISNGTLVLDGTNSGSGLVTLSTNTSILKLKLTNGLVNAALAGTSSTASRGTVDLTQGGDYVMASLGNSVTPAQNINFTNSSRVVSTLTFTAPTNYLTLSSGGSSGRTIQNSSANLTMIFNAIDIGSTVSNNATFNGDGSFIVNGAIFNTNTNAIRDLVKNGTGSLTLNGANTYNGSTTVSGGTLVAGNSSAIPSPAVSVASGATLEVRASIANTVTNSGTVRIVSGGAMSASQISSGSLELGSATGQASLALSGDYQTLTSFGMTGNAAVTMPVLSTISALSVNLAGENNTLSLSGTPGVGLYTLISSTVSWTIAPGFGISAIVDGQTIPLGQSVEIGGNNYSFMQRNGENRLVLDVTPAGAKLLAYDDSVGGGWNTDPTNLTWINGSGSSASFANGDIAKFNGTGSTSVTVTGTVEPVQLTFTIGTGGVLQLSGGTIKAGTVMVDGDGSVGVGSLLQVDSSMTVQSGTINLDSAATAADVIVMGGTLGGSGTLEAGSYQFSGGTVSVSLIGTGSLTLSGNATISGNNSGFSGPVALVSGSVTLNGDNPLGSGEIALSGGSLINLGTDGMTLANRVQLGTGGGGASVPSNQSATMSGGITNRSGTNTLIKAGAGALSVTGKVGLGVSGGDAINSYIGLSVSNGVLRLTGSPKFIGNAAVNTGSSLLLDGVQVNTWGSTISGAGNVQVTNQVVLNNLGGNSTFSNSVLVHPNGRLSSSNGFSNATTYTLFANGVNGPSGTLAIGGTNRLTGISSIGNIEIQNGAVLRVINGTISNTAVTNSGKLDFNNSSGILAVIGTNLVGGVTNYTTAVNGDFVGNGLISISGSKDVVLNGQVGGGNALMVEGTSSGSFWLTRSNSFTGGIILSNGTTTTNVGTGSIHFSTSDALGTGRIVNANGTTKGALYYEATNQTCTVTNDVDTGSSSTGVVAFGVGAATNTLNLDSLVSGSGILKVTGSTNGELRVRNPLNSYTGGTEVGNGTIHITNGAVLGTGIINFGTVSNSILKIQGPVALNQSVTMTTNSNTAIIDNSDDVSIEGYIYPVSNSGGNFTKNGSGRLTLKLPYYYGVTTVNSGTLDLGGNAVYGAGVVMASGNLENGTLYSYGSTGIKASGGMVGANLAGEGGLTFDPVTNRVVRLSGLNSFSGLVKLGTTNNQTLEVTRVESLSPNADLSGSSSSANTPTLSLLAGGEYAMNQYRDGNMIFAGTGSTTLTFASTEGNTIAGGNKTLTATNMNVVFQGPVDLAPNQTNKYIALAGNGNFTFRGPIVNSVSGTNAGIVVTNSVSVWLEATNSYDGSTVIAQGTLIVATNGALPTNSAVTVSSGALLKFNKSSGGISVGSLTNAGTLQQNLVTITSSGAVDLTGSTLTVNDTPSASSYILVTGTSLTGIPTLSPSISGYELRVSENNLLLQQVDTTKPVITLIGATSVNVAYGASYTDLGATVTDNRDAERSINGVGSVNTLVPGSYTITFNATDAASNVANTVTRTVVVGPAPVQSGYATYLSDNNLPADTAFNEKVNGVAVGLKYAFGSVSGMPQNNGVTAVPVIAQLPNGDQQMTYTFDVKDDSPPLTVTYQTSTDLVNWTTAQAVSAATGAAPTSFLKKQVQVTGSDRLFVKLNVTR
jgi:autotransporter-associated beta strand protein